MLLFAVLMIAASFSMIRGNPVSDHEKEGPACMRFFKLLGYGVAIGLIAGILGAGGGFLLIPALVLLVKLPMKKAVGTSLMIIAFNSLLGFAGDLGHFTVDWPFLTVLTSIAIAGIFIGTIIGRRLHSGKLKKGFGWFVLVMGVYIIIKEIFFPGSIGH